MKSFTIQNSDIDIGCRLEPSFYRYSVIIREQCIAQGVSFEKLGSLCECISDGEHSAIPRIKEAGVRYLYGRNIKDGIVNFDPETDSSYISDEDYKKFTRIYVKEGDLLITIVGTVGKVAVYAESYIGKAGIPRHIAKIRLKKNSWATPEYVLAYFLSRLGKHQIENITTGNIQPLLSLVNIKSLDIPRISEEYISEFTTKLRKSVDLETKALELIECAKDRLYKALQIDFEEIESPKIYTLSYSDFKDYENWNSSYSLPLYLNTQKAIKEKWKTITLEEVTRFIKGDEVGSDNYSVYLEKKEDDVPFIRTSDIVNYEVDSYPDFYIPREIYTELDQGIETGDILFTNDGKIGQVCIVTDMDKFILQSHIRAIRLNKKGRDEYHLTPEYLFTALSLREIGIYQAKRYTVIQSTIPTMAGNLPKVEIPIVDDAAMLEITNLVREAFKLKAERKRLVADVRKTIDSYFDI